MKRFSKEFDVIVILMIMITMFFMISVRMFVNDVIVGKFGINNEMTSWILTDLTIGANVQMDEWSKKYPFQDSLFEKVIKEVNVFKGNINIYCTASVPGSTLINQVIQGYNNAIGFKIDNSSGTYANAFYIKEIAEQVGEFSNYLNDKKIPFIYVQTPLLESIWYRQGKEIADTPALDICERNLYLLTQLQEMGICTIDMADKLLMKEWVGENSFDHTAHWSLESGLYAAEEIVRELNDNYGFEFSLETFKNENYKDLLEGKEDIRNEIETLYGQKYNVPIPLDNNSMYVIAHGEGNEWSGSFEEVFINEPDESMYEEPYHGFLRLKNETVYNIYHEQGVQNKKKRLLIIGDSFNWPVASYLAQEIECVDIIHNASFTGSIKSYINAMGPDAVIVCYNDAEFYPIYTQAAYDFE